MIQVTVTGGSGFIGGWLVERLAATGAAVTCIARATSDCRRVERAGAKVIRASLDDERALAAAVSGATIVYHVAGQIGLSRQGEMQSTNGQGVDHVAAACARQASPPVLVVISSLAATHPARDGKPVCEQDTPAPLSQYGRSKLEGERAARRWAGKIPISIVRPAVVFGEYDRQLLKLIGPAEKLGLVLAPGTRHARLSFIHVDDLASLILLAGERGQRLEMNETDKGVYFGTDDRHLSYAELAEVLREAMGRKSMRSVNVPAALVRLSGVGALVYRRMLGQTAVFNPDKAIDGLAGSWICTSAKAKAELGFEPAKTLEERWRQTIEWYRREKWL